MMLANIDYLTAQINELTARIEVLCEPYLRRSRRSAVPGHGAITAQDLIGEIGTDMTVFPTGAHLASWARWVPQVTSSGGKRKGSNATGRGNPYLGAAVGEAVVNAGRTGPSSAPNTTGSASGCRRRKPSVPSGTACSHIYHDLLSDPEATTPPRTGYYQQKMHIARQVRSHARAIERHGYKVSIEAIDPATGELRSPSQLNPPPSQANRRSAPPGQLPPARQKPLFSDQDPSRLVQARLATELRACRGSLRGVGTGCGACSGSALQSIP